MAGPSVFTLRARTVVPVSQPPIDDGAVSISGNRITFVGRWHDLPAEGQACARDLGEVLLMPGLVNAHCHLDYTDMAGEVSAPRTFTDWIKAITTLKASWHYSDYAQSWVNGAHMLVRTGTTTVGDIEAVPELLPDVWETTPLRVFSFQELINVRNRRPAHEIIADAGGGLGTLPARRGGVGLSPHALYTASADLLQHAAKYARENGWRVTTHVAESHPEFEMFMYQRGDMYEWLKKNGRDMSDCGRSSPVGRLEQLGLLDGNFLAVHVNYLWRDDARLLGERGVSVVHCPRSHDYFKHQCFPRQDLNSAGVNICLGTDSLVSTNRIRRQPLELNMFEEMRCLAASSGDGLSPEQILQMATINGAKALGRGGEFGELRGGALADIIAIPSASGSPFDAVLQHRGDVTASIINGCWAISPS